MKVLIPRRFSALMYGVIQAAITSAVATTIATYQASPVGTSMLWYWLRYWSLSWIAMLPIVILVAPLIQRTVLWLTEPSADHSAG